MAHIKVQRRSMRPEEWTDLRFNWLKRHIYSYQSEIDCLEIRDARQTGENSYEFYSDSYRPLHRGDMYFTPDGTAFIRGRVSVPHEIRDKKVCLKLKTAAEITVKINGKYVGGVDPNREKINIYPYVNLDEPLEIEMVGYNRSKPDDERNPESLSVRGCRQIFEGCYFVVVDEQIQSLVYDFETLINIRDSEDFDEDYRHFLTKELNSAMNLVSFDDDGSVSGAEEAGKYIEKNIYENKTYKGSGKVALVGHSHLDIAYYWRRIHAVQKNMRTVLIQLRLMDEYPELKYTHTQPYLYETLEKYYPEIFEELKEKIKSGNFEPVGAMYVEPDCNIPSAESLIRQCYYGQKTYKRMFGFRVNSAWLPDVFGNSWILPQILKKSGVDYFVSNKMSTWNDTNRFPHNSFIWRGIDGSEVIASVPPTHFITWNEPSQIADNWNAFEDKDTGEETLNMFGYGDGGSGCTEEMLELYKREKRLSVMPEINIEGGKEYLEKNLEATKDKLETWDGELYLEMHRGTFTTKSLLKKLNRKLEYKFRNAELLSVLSGQDNQSEIDSLYKLFLINQFHDILPGSHIRLVFEDAVKDLEKIDSSLDKIISSTGDENYFNTLNFSRDEVEFVEDENGNTERLGKNGFFTSTGLASLTGGKIENRNTDDYYWFSTSGGKVKTPYYEIIFSPDGSITSLTEISDGRQWADGEFNKIKLFDDRPGNYDAWDILPNYRDKEFSYDVKEKLSLKFADSESAEFSCVLKLKNSEWKRTVRIFRRSRGIEVEENVDWHEKHVLAKSEFNVNILARKARADLTAGFTERDTSSNTSWQKARFETCFHNWADISETGAGLAIITESKYGIGFDKNRMSLSLLRSTERPDVISDMGKHDFCYLIYPHDKGFDESEINKKALIYNVPLVKTDAVNNILPSFSPLYIQCVKRSDDGSVVVRLSEQDGRRGKVKLDRRVRILNMLEDYMKTETDEIDYSPFEIITLSLPNPEKRA